MPMRHVAALLRTAKRMSSPTERAQHAALKAELRIAADLDDLPAGWFVPPSLPTMESLGESSGDSDDDLRPDHVVVGPGGLFLIYVEHRSGAKVWVSEHKLTIDGRDSDRLRRARFAARRASGRISQRCGFDVPAQSVLVLIGAATMHTLSRPAEVHVRTEHDLRDWLCRQPDRLVGDQPAVVSALLSSAATPRVDVASGLLE